MKDYLAWVDAYCRPRSAGMDMLNTWVYLAVWCERGVPHTYA